MLLPDEWNPFLIEHRYHRLELVHESDVNAMDPQQSPAPAAWMPCTCNHVPAEHRDRTGACTALDSYGQPCGCPSFELDISLDDAAQ